jgi:PAS domain S-box-containing protein
VSRAPPGRGGLPAGQVPAAGAPEGSGAVVTRQVLLGVLDVLPDGIALVDGHGWIMLASRRLEEMFGYQHDELTGRPVAALLPANGQAAWPHEPKARPAGAGARLAGVSKDRTSFPAEITISPVPAGAGHCAVVIRDATGTLQPEDPASTAVAKQEHRVQDLLDTVIASLLAAGVSLQTAATDPPTDATAERITAVLGDLDDAIRVIRDTEFTTPAAARHCLPRRSTAPGEDTHA